MTWTDLLRHAFAGIGQHKLRALLTLMGVILGSLLLFTSLSGGLGVINAVNERLEVGNRLREVTVLTGMKIEEVTPEAARNAGFTQEMNEERRLRLAKAAGVGGQTVIPVTIETVDQLKQIDHVAHAWGLLRFGASVQLGEHELGSDQWRRVSIEAIPPSQNPFGPLIVAGVNIAGEPNGNRVDEIEDPPSQNGQVSSHRDSDNPVIVSELLLYQRGVRTDQQLKEIIGTKLTVRTPSKIAFDDRVCTIVGVYRHPTRSELRGSPDLVAAISRQILMPYPQAVEHWKETVGVDRPISAKILADQPRHVASIEKAIDELGFRSVSLSELALQIRTAVLLITGIITAIAGGALFISAIGITNTMVMNVMQRRKDIAIMKAIGAKDSDVNRMFLVEGMLLGVFGGLIGLILGWTLTRFSSQHITAVLESQLNEPFIGDIFAYPNWLIVGTPVVAAIVTTLATFLPARRAAKIDPAKTLRAL